MLQIHSLHKLFGDFHAVNDVSIEVKEGELVTLLGPSGCGKSTTLRCVAGLETPTAGEIRIGDRLMVAPRRGIDVPPEKRRIGMVFQSYALWPHMSVVDNVAYPLRSQKLGGREATRRAEAALELVGLAQYVRASPGTLSGGQQQRVALGRALASECHVLLFDEPLSNLDVRLREQMRNEIRDLQLRLGITAMYVTHDQSEALALSDKIAVMNEGRIVQVGTPREVYERPATAFAATFLGNVNLLPVEAIGRSNCGSFDSFRLVDGSEVRLAAGERVLEAGEPKHLGLRSELMRLSAEPVPDTVNSWAGHIEQAIFLGDSIEYLIRAIGTRIKVRVPPYVRFHDGEEVIASVAPEDCFIVDAAS